MPESGPAPDYPGLPERYTLGAPARPGDSRMQTLDRFLPPAILVIEDDRSLLDVVEQVLAWQGFRVLTATSAKEAHEAEYGYAGPIHLIVSDVHLEGCRGPEIVRDIRARRDRVAAIYMSGYERDKALAPDELGPGDGFMHKPFSLRGLQIQVRNVMDLAVR